MVPSLYFFGHDWLEERLEPVHEEKLLRTLLSSVNRFCVDPKDQCVSIGPLKLVCVAYQQPYIGQPKSLVVLNGSTMSAVTINVRDPEHNTLSSEAFNRDMSEIFDRCSELLKEKESPCKGYGKNLSEIALKKSKKVLLGYLEGLSSD